MSRKQSTYQGPQTRTSMTTEYQARFLPQHCNTIVTTSVQKNANHQRKGTSAKMTTIKKQSTYHGPQTQTYMTTEYQARFLPQHCNTIVTTSVQKNPNHQLRGTSAEMTTVRKQSNYQGPQTRSYMTTEYQARFLPPHSNTIVTTSVQKNPNHQLKGTSAEMTTVRSIYMAQKWVKYPQKAPQPCLPPKKQQRYSSTLHNPGCCAPKQKASNVEVHTSVYKNDFKAWKAKRLQPIKMVDTLKVKQGLVYPDDISNRGQPQRNGPVPEPMPFESVTSYRLNYVNHPVQPRQRMQKPVYQTNNLLRWPAVPSKPKVALDVNQDLFDNASEFYQKFRSLNLEGKLQGKPKYSGPPANYISTTHAAYRAHKCPRTKPVPPPRQEIEMSKEPFQGTTTTMEDYKAWDIPRRLPVNRTDRPRKPIFPLSTSEGYKTNPRPSSMHYNVSDTALCHPTKNHQRPPENAAFAHLECVSNGSEELWTYWATSLHQGVTWVNDGICVEA